MSKYLTAKQLGTNEAVRRGLIDVMECLKAGVYTHEKSRYEMPVVGKYFNMCYWGERTNCQTVKCIGGWLNVKIGRDFNEQLDTHNTETLHAFNRLFHPNSNVYWRDITPEMAAQAIDNFLRFRDPKWDEITKDMPRKWSFGSTLR